jgi:hypothetical protein
MNLPKLQEMFENFQNASDEAQDAFVNCICGNDKAKLDPSTHDEVSTMIDDFRKADLNEKAATLMATKLAALDDDDEDDEDLEGDEPEVDDDDDDLLE